MQHNNNDSSLATFLAAKVKSEVAQKALFDSGLRPVLYELATNQNLSKEVWVKIAKIKSDVELTFTLISKGRRDPGEEQLRLILKDPRPRIRRNVFFYLLANVSRDFFTELRDTGKLDRDSAGDWLFGERIPPELLIDVAAIDRGYAQVELLKLRYLYSDEQAIKALPGVEAAESWNSSNLWELFDYRPELIPTAIRLGDEHILTAAASSRHLFDEALFMEILSRTAVNADDWRTALITSIVMAHPNSSVAATKAAADLHTAILSSVDSDPERAKLEIRSATWRKVDGLLKDPITEPWEQLPEDLLSAALETFHAAEHRYPTLFTWEQNGRVFGPEPKDPHLAETYVYDSPLERIGSSEGYLSPSSISLLQLEEQIQRPLDAIGYKAWQAFIELSLNWSLSIQELLQTTIGLF